MKQTRYQRINKLNKKTVAPSNTGQELQPNDFLSRELKGAVA